MAEPGEVPEVGESGAGGGLDVGGANKRVLSMMTLRFLT